jgi:hypothetical protein
VPGVEWIKKPPRPCVCVPRNREQIQEVQTRSEERRGGDGSPGSSGASEGNLGSRSRQPVDEFDQLGTSLEGVCVLCHQPLVQQGPLALTRNKQQQQLCRANWTHGQVR